MRSLSREFSLFGEIEKWEITDADADADGGDSHFDVIIDTTDGGGGDVEFRAPIEPAMAAFRCARVWEGKLQLPSLSRSDLDAIAPKS